MSADEQSVVRDYEEWEDAALIEEFLARTSGMPQVERGALIGRTQQTVSHYEGGFRGPLRKGTRGRIENFLRTEYRTAAAPAHAEPGPTAADQLLDEDLLHRDEQPFAPPSAHRLQLRAILPNLEGFGPRARLFMMSWVLGWLQRGQPIDRMQLLARELAGVLVAAGVANRGGPGRPPLRDAQQEQVLRVIAEEMEASYGLTDSPEE